jgi:exodeoxyribonuclease-3
MKIATWNVNSLNVRLPHVLDWIEANKPDALCLQETKQEDIKFPYDALKEAGYNAIHTGQKTYNGVAILSPHEMTDVHMAIPNFADEQKRLIAATINGVRIVCVYIPNGQAVDSEKYQYKLSWLEAFTPWLQAEIAKYPKLALLGDYNIAPEDIDCHDPAAWVGQVLVSPLERDAFKKLIELGLEDSFRLFDKNEGQFSWWDYRMAGFRRNLGMRIDHILITPALKEISTTSYIDKAPRKLERPSDHTPVVLEMGCE